MFIIIFVYILLLMNTGGIVHFENVIYDAGANLIIFHI